MFVDRAKINVKAGNGGKGCESYYFQRRMRFRRRDGGDGGRGGDIVLATDENINTLLDFRYRQHFQADSGKHGSSSLKRGADGKDRIILIPQGTIIRDEESGLLIRDMNMLGEQVIVAKGGAGGRGNGSKREVTVGSPGQEKTISLELKLIADVGLIGYPNAGKSSFLNAISGAKSKVAHFPFTTLSPVLGVVHFRNSDYRFVVADIPGIIKDAHKGKGLGMEFLKHIERTKLLVFVIDLAAEDGRDPVQDFNDLRHELREYDSRLLKRPYLIVANKMDLPAARNNLDMFKRSIKGKVLNVSCKTAAGVDKVLEQMKKKLDQQLKVV